VESDEPDRQQSFGFESPAPRPERPARASESAPESDPSVPSPLQPGTRAPVPQATDPPTVEGILTQIRFRDRGFCIAALDDGTTVKGPLTQPEVGLRYRFSGSWVLDARYGRQFAFRRYQPLYPQDPAGIRAYLIQHGPGIGPTLSRRLVDQYGAKTLEVCRREPERVAREVQGLRPALATGLAERLAAAEDLEAQYVALNGLFAGLKVPRQAAQRIVERYGQQAEQRVREQPYALARQIRGIGFTLADAIASRVGIAGSDPRRLRAATLHVLEREASGQGHTCLRDLTLRAHVGELLGIEPSGVDRSVDQLVLEGTCRREGSLVALASLADAEASIARRLRALAGARPRPGTPDPSGLAGDQIRALEQALSQGVFVLTGAPGTGKTYTIRRILDSFPDARIALAAPTGKAAKRITEQTGRPAQTIHRLLEPIYRGDGFGFGRNAEQPLEVDLVVLDEVSMIDVPLMARFLEAVPDTARLILVGDSEQLPAVGPGNVLGDVIRSGRVAVAELDQIKRQDEGWIVQNCHRIRRGERVHVDNAHSRDFFLIERSHVHEIRDTLIELVSERLPRRYGTDPLRDQQVLVPLRARTELSCDALNRVLQRRLNPRACEASAQWGGESGAAPAAEDELGARGAAARIALGDKVIQTRNAYELGIFNGDLGTVEVIEGRSLQVRFDAPERLVDLDVERNDLELAYALTVHKYQGSESRIVVIPIHPSAGSRILQRSWLYTAISRAREVCVLVGSAEELARTVLRDRSHVRSTRLASLLSQAAS